MGEAYQSVKMPIMKEIKEALEIAKENTGQLLNDHIVLNGEVQKKNKYIANMYRDELTKIDELLAMDMFVMLEG